MPRHIEVSAPAGEIDRLLDRIENAEGVVSTARHSGASLSPPGDVLKISTTTDASHTVLAIIDELGIVSKGTFTSSSVSSLVSDKHKRLLGNESNEAPWDEVAFLLRKDTNISANYLIGMFLAGAIAAGGLWTNTLHLVIAAMLVAPGFEPLVRPALGIIAGASSMVANGIKATLAGYGLMALGGALTALLLALTDPGPGTRLDELYWVRYWSTLTVPGVLVSAFAGIAGAVVVSAHRSVLTTGVMVALALIPSMTLVGMGLVTGNVSLAAGGLLRWAIDALLVMLMSVAVFAVKKRLSHHGQHAQS